jgi:cobalt-zinc-cadmium efflux system outer membrane protein
MEKRLLTLLIALLATATARAADPPDHPISLSEALAIARTENPALRAVRAHTFAVQAGEVTAALRPNPVFTSANEDFNVFNPSKFDPVNTQEFTQNVAWLIERGGKRQARINAARLTTAVANATLTDTERQLDLQVKLAFVNYLLGNDTLKLAEDNLEGYKQVIEANQVRLTAGDISQTDFDRIKIEEASFQSDLLSARTSMLQARSQLAALLGIADATKLNVTGQLNPPPVEETLAALQHTALQHRPDYLAARQNVQKAEADLTLARANGATDVSIGPEYKRNGPDNTIGIVFQIPLRVFDRNQGEKLRTSRELESSRYAEEAARLQVLSDVQQAWDAYQSALERHNLYTKDYLQRSQTVLERLTFSYQHGATSLLDYLDAIRSHRDVQLGALAADSQALAAIHQLSYATATELLP